MLNLKSIGLTLILLIGLLIIVAYWYAALAIAAITLAYFAVSSLRWVKGQWDAA